jgi:hypothetical protein
MVRALGMFKRPYSDICSIASSRDDSLSETRAILAAAIRKVYCRFDEAC